MMNSKYNGTPDPLKFKSYIEVPNPNSCTAIELPQQGHILFF